ncbi:MAG: hypothetical protein N0A15_16545, partial [Anaerolineae bacterium]|nr:hypothetical protein [Anaerolineae bacterium]
GHRRRDERGVPAHGSARGASPPGAALRHRGLRARVYSVFAPSGAIALKHLKQQMVAYLTRRHHALGADGSQLADAHRAVEKRD